MLSLTDLRARQVVPAWQEAVAVVQELIHTVGQTQGRAVQLPDIDHIALIANGEVVALPGSPPTGNPVRHAAQLLEQMLEGGAAPPELVTLVNDNATDTPQLANLSELTRQLAFFERPGRRSDVEGLVSRAMSADAQNRAEDELRRLKERTLIGEDLDAFQSESEIQEQKNARKPRVGLRQAAMTLAALLLVAAIAGGGWWLYGWYRDGGLASLTAAAPDVEEEARPEAAPARDADEAPPAAATGAGAAPDAEAAKAPSLFDRARASIQRAVESTFGPSPAADEEAPAAADAAEEPAPRGTGVSRSRARRSASAASKPASGSASGSAPTAAVPGEKPQVSTTVTKPPMTSEPTSVSSVSDARSVVYSKDDADVRPAVLLRPLLPAEPPPDVPPDQIGTLELIVDEFGDVEQVRLISPANRFHERMLVSHAKSWKFRPAIRDGQPVKYLTIIRLTI